MINASIRFSIYPGSTFHNAYNIYSGKMVSPFGMINANFNHASFASFGGINANDEMECSAACDDSKRCVSAMFDGAYCSFYDFSIKVSDLADSVGNSMILPV